MCTPMRDLGSEDDSEELLDPLESTQMLDTAFLERTVTTNTAAGDSILIALTDSGKVYGWGTFRCPDSNLRFNEKTRIQSIPVLLSTLKNIVQCAATISYHSFAVTKDWIVEAWGLNQYDQYRIYDHEHAGEGNVVIPIPTVVQSLKGGQLGLDLETLIAEDVGPGTSRKPHYLSTPHVVPSIKLPSAGCGT
ncbi:hypothetical protein HOY80DRAFT_1105818 [Tuber brumale]|nr:hypothetical protein HOY80DRAFT_1105818 [Tuber brumale]